jgi:hypothetical protein
MDLKNETGNKEVYKPKNALQGLLSEFSRIKSSESAPQTLYEYTGDDFIGHSSSYSKERFTAFYNYVYKNLNISYDLRDIERILNPNSRKLEKIVEANRTWSKEADSHVPAQENEAKLGLFLSAVINKAAEKENKENYKYIDLVLPKRNPIKRLFFKSEDIDVYMNVAGTFPGTEARGVNIYIGKLYGTLDKDFFNGNNSIHLGFKHSYK